jgi:hypothetical protein
MNMECEWSCLELAEYAAGEPSDKIHRHLPECESCRRRIEAIRKTDAALQAIPRLEPTDTAVLRIRQALGREIRGHDAHEVMTLEDVADFLRATPEALLDLLDDLPAFEFAGQIRVRRSRLIEWVEERERRYLAEKMESQMSRSPTRRHVKGVA